VMDEQTARPATAAAKSADTAILFHSIPH